MISLTGWIIASFPEVEGPGIGVAKAAPAELGDDLLLQLLVPPPAAPARLGLPRNIPADPILSISSNLQVVTIHPQFYQALSGLSL